MMKLWAGRFERDTDALTDELNSSLAFDRRLYAEDILGSVAHAEMLGAQGIISGDEAEKIVAGLREILFELQSGALELPEDAEDIHMCVEAILTERIGEAGKRLHTARSRNDQVALDLRMYLKKEIGAIIGLLLSLMETVNKTARENTRTIMPAYTHLQRAQPTTLAHYMMAYANMLRRDVTRLEDCLSRMDEMPLGSGALTGTTHPVDRRRVADALGFARITENSIDGVSDRDYVIELLSALSLVMMHLSRFCEEIIMWCSWEFRFAELDDAFSTGSSIMPQKKNPDIAELTRGKTGRVYGALMSVLTVMKGLPLAYNKDMQEDKEAVFDAVDTVKKCLPVFTAMLDTMTFSAESMRKAAASGYINATDCADYLVKRGMPFREAYAVTGRLISWCIHEKKALEALTLEEYRSFSQIFGEDVFEAVKLENCVNGRISEGGPSAAEVERQIKSIERFVRERRAP